jgi:hypothetical protein
MQLYIYIYIVFKKIEDILQFLINDNYIIIYAYVIILVN